MDSLLAVRFFSNSFTCISGDAQYQNGGSITNMFSVVGNDVIIFLNMHYLFYLLGFIFVFLVFFFWRSPQRQRWLPLDNRSHRRSGECFWASSLHSRSGVSPNRTPLCGWGSLCLSSSSYQRRMYLLLCYIKRGVLFLWYSDILVNMYACEVHACVCAHVSMCLLEEH